MRRTSRLLVVFGIGLAVLTFVLILALLPGGGGGTAGGPGATPTPGPVTVVVAAKDIPLGTVVTADMLTTTTVPPTQAKPGVFTTSSLVIGQVARQGIVTGEQVSAGDFATEQATLTVPAGKRALAVAVNELTGVGNLVYPGDWVDIVITLDANAIPIVNVPAPNTYAHDQALAPVTVKASALLQDIQVLGTLQAPVAAPVAGASPAPSQGPTFNGGSLTGKLIILAVTDQQAEAILFARYFNTLVATSSGNATASINLVLRSPADASAPPVNTSGVDLKTLFQQYGVVPPYIEKAINAFIAQQP
ncbi:MAG TPA: Flp pilus assembly protein CpaB [Candidatus Binatus sp.]|nr:Flp pilus assembly protein CpaB [Candidatus Binatus sp.]